MSRGRKRTKAEKQRRREATAKKTQPAAATAGSDDKLLEDLVCAQATANNAAGLCDARLADLGFDLTYAQLAAKLWPASGGKSHAIGEALADFAAECQRHHDRLQELYDHLDHLAKQHTLHDDHLDLAAITLAVREAFGPTALT